MERVDFIKALADELSQMARASDIHQLIDYYDEMILDLMEDGYSERAAVAKLGDPRKLAREACGVPEIERAFSKHVHPLVVLLLIVGFPLWGSLVLAGGLVFLSCYFIIWLIPLIGLIFGGTFSLVGVVSAIFSLFLMTDSLFMGVTQFGIGMLFFGLGILCLTFTYTLGGFFAQVTKSVTLWCKQLLFKKRKQVVRYEA